MSTISVIIITYNEALAIRNCLEAVTWADEIIIVDSGSTDNTLNICHEYTNKIYEEKQWQGFGYQKNRALTQATKEWVLSIDADEIVSIKLQEEIKKAIQQTIYTAYKIPFQLKFCGKYLKHVCKSEKHLRLFRRTFGKFDNNIVHENLIITGKIGILKNYIIHESYRDQKELAEKIERYATAGAEKLFKEGKNSGFIQALWHGIGAFIKTYFLKLGILDAGAGLLIAIANTKYSYHKYMKLRALNLR